MTQGERLQFEQTIIGAVMFSSDTHPGKVLAARQALRPEFFSVKLHRHVIAAVFECYEKGYEANFVNVVAVGNLSADEQAQLAGIEGGSANLTLLSRKLAECVLMDRFQEFRSSITEEADVFELLDRLRRLDEEAGAIITANTRKDKHSLLTEYADFLLNKDGMKRIPTGIPTLDSVLGGGLDLGGFTLLGGVPGIGKTSFMLNVSLYAAQQGVQVGFIEAEMRPEEIFARLNGIKLGESIREIRGGERYKELSEGFIADLHELPIEFRFPYDRTLSSLVAEIQSLAHDGCKLIVVDYLQPFADKAGKAQDEYLSIKRVSEKLRQLALLHNVNLLVGSALNRNEVGKTDRLTLSSLYGSSGLGHDCSVAMLLRGDQNADEELMTKRRAVILDVVKSRNGARGEVPLSYDLASQRMTESVNVPVEHAVGFSDYQGG